VRVDGAKSTLDRLTEKIRQAPVHASKVLGYRLQPLPRPLLARPGSELKLHLDYAIALRLTATDDFFFVQIGACDGRMDDPLYGWVNAYGLRGLLVEPQPRLYSELLETYRDAKGLEFRQVAVGEREEKRTLYTIAAGPGVPRWAAMLASFERDVLLSHREFLPEVDELLREEEVQSVALNDLLAEAPTDHIDLLQIDVEGYDSELIRILDLERFRPSIIHFEHEHLSRAQHEASVTRLIEHGYLVGLEEHDTLAYRPEEKPRASTSAAAVEGPGRRQRDSDQLTTEKAEPYQATIEELERRLAASVAWTEQMTAEAEAYRAKSLEEQKEFYESLLHDAVERAEAAEARLPEADQ
jgi:FkbM family methyltransferase